jgi:hypothetical protein
MWFRAFGKKKLGKRKDKNTKARKQSCWFFSFFLSVRSPEGVPAHTSPLAFKM